MVPPKQPAAYFRLRHEESGLCLATVNGADTGDTETELQTCDSTTDDGRQEWFWKGYQLRNKKADKCLGGDNGDSPHEDGGSINNGIRIKGNCDWNDAGRMFWWYRRSIMLQQNGFVLAPENAGTLATAGTKIKAREPVAPFLGGNSEQEWSYLVY